MSLEFTPDPRQESEARLTALLLGEITGAEAASLRETIEADPELAALYERLKKTVVLVREVSADPAQPLATPGANPATPLKLSEERRQKLLAQFKTVKPKEFAKAEKHQRPSWMLSVGIAAAIMLLLGSLAVQNFVHSRFTGQQNAIINNLRQLDGAKQTWAMENHKAADAVPTFKDIEPYMGRGSSGLPEPIAGEKYVLGPVWKPPVAVAKGKLYSLDDEGPVQVDSMVPAGKIVPTPSVKLHAKFVDVTPSAAPTAPAQLAQNNRQQIYLPPAENTSAAAPAQPASNDARNFAMADGSVQQFSTSQLRSGGTGGGAANVLNFQAGDVRDLSQNQNQFGVSTGIVVTNSANLTFYTDLNRNGDPAWTAGLSDSSRSYVATNGFIGNYAFTGIPAGSNLDLDSIHNLGDNWKLNTGAAGATDQNGNVQLSFNTQPAPTVAQDKPIIALRPPPASGLADQLNEPQVATEFGKRATTTSTLGINAGKPIEQQKDNAGLPMLGEVPQTGALFSRNTPAEERKPVQSQHGAQLLTQRAEPAARPQAVTPLPGGRATETEAASTPPPAEPAAPLASTAVPDQAPVKQEEYGRLIGGLSNQWNYGTGNSAPATAGPNFDDLSAQNKLLGYGNANPDKAKNFGADKPAPTSTAGTIVSTNFASAGFALLGPPSSPENKPAPDPHLGFPDDQQLAALYDTKKQELAQLQKSREVMALRMLEQDVDTNSAKLRANKQPESELAELNLEIREKESQMVALNKRMGSVESIAPRSEQKVATPDVNDAPLPRTVVPPPVPQPEVFTSTNAFSTFSLNIADVSFKLAAASLDQGVMPDPASIRSEEFINAFDYRDPEAPAGVPIAFAWERARDPFAQNRDLLRFSLKTAATGRAPGRPLNIVLLLDNSGSMERADRVQIIHEALRVLASQLQPQDTLSIVTFARTPRLFVDGVPGNQAGAVVEQVSGLTPQGGTNLEDAMRLAYETALRHYLANGINRVVLLTDGAANLGNVDPESLKQSVEAHRKQGVALDCFGIGWEGYNDDLLEVLARNGDGRYGFLNSPEEAANGFAHQLAGALNVAAEDVKVQVEFNPRRVTVYRQVGYAKLQLTKEQFRDNTVAAAQVGAAEAGNALYVLQVDPNGDGPLATVRVRYKVPGTQDVEEHEWSVPYTGNAVALEQSSPAMRLAGAASAFSEWLANSPYAAEVSPDVLLQDLSGVPATFAPDTRPQKLVEMIREAKSISGK